MRFISGSRVKAAIAMTIGVTVAALAPVAPAHAEDVYRPFKTINFNFCGSACNDPSNPNIHGWTDLTPKVTELTAKITSWQPQVVFLQEVCLDQLNTIVSSLSTSSWPMWAGTVTKTDHYTDVAPTVVPQGFVSDDKGRTCLGPGGVNTVGKLGNAMLVRTSTSLSGVTDTNLNATPGAWRPMLCAKLSDAPYNTKACVAHLNTPGGADLADEARLASIAAMTSSTGSPVVVGGDFNMSPTNAGLDYMYQQGGTGPHPVFEEADQCSTRAGYTPENGAGNGCNEWTKDNDDAGFIFDWKIDYTFLRQAYFRPNVPETKVFHSAYSDHGYTLALARECSSSVMATCN